MSAVSGDWRSDMVAPLDRAGWWRPTATMHEAREGHTATRLTDGRVLVAGGDLHGARFLGGCELYDPRDLRWHRAAPMATPRAAHTATLLEDGRVLVVGGVNSWGSVAAVEVYDPWADAWSDRAALCTARSGHAAAHLSRGVVLCTGGMDLERNPPAPLASVEVYDPVLDLWDGGASMLRPRAGHSATVLDASSVLVLGGGGPGGPSGPAEVYRARDDAWEATRGGWITHGRSTATDLGQGRVLVAGDVRGAFHDGATASSAALYCHETRRFRPAGEMATPRRCHAAARLGDGGVLVIGGSNGDGFILDETEMHDPATSTWGWAGHLGTPRMFHTATLLPEGDVLVAGGLSGRGGGLTSLDSAELFSPERRG